MECCKSLIQCVEQTGWRRNITTSPKWNHSGSQLQCTGGAGSHQVLDVGRQAQFVQDEQLHNYRPLSLSGIRYQILVISVVTNDQPRQTTPCHSSPLPPPPRHSYICSFQS
nr:uncharacterized protein LOC128698632 isoform X1 [Cherax quadricarinatus]